MLKSQHKAIHKRHNKALSRLPTTSNPTHKLSRKPVSNSSTRRFATNDPNNRDADPSSRSAEHEDFAKRSQRRTQAHPRTKVVSDTDYQSSQQQQQQQQQQATQSQIQSEQEEDVPELQPESPATDYHPPEPPRSVFNVKNSARLVEDVAVDTRLTPQHVQQLGSLLNVPSIHEKKSRLFPLTVGSNPNKQDESNFYLPKVQFLYNPSTGSHPAMPFFLYPNPTINPEDYESALHSGKLYPRYSYNTARDGMLQHIRGVYYLPQFGQQHLLSQGRLEYYKPIILADKLKYVIQAGLPSHVEKHEKHRDRIDVDEKGKIIGLRPQQNRNSYYTAVEHCQIQTQTGELCADYQVQHLFYNQVNDILVTQSEQKKRQKLEFVYDQLQEKKIHDLLDDLRELTVRADYEILPDGKYPAIFIAEQQSRDEDAKRLLVDKIEQLGGVPPTDMMYWDINHAQMRISKGDVFDFLRMSNNNNKMCFNPRFAGFHGHDGTVIPMEYLATLALQEVIDFSSRFCPEEPSIWRDIKNEAIILQQEHLRDQLLQDHRVKWQAYSKFRKSQKRFKQNQEYEHVYREHQQKMEAKRQKVADRREGKRFGVVKTVLETRRDFIDKENEDKMPLPEDIVVSSDDEGRDIELDTFKYAEEVTLNQDHINFIKEQTKTPPWHVVFQQVRRFEFRSLTSITFGENKRLSSHLPEKDLDDEFINLNFYARLLEDQFDYNSYHAVLRGAQDQFELQLQKVKAGLLPERELDLGQMISFSDICRDRPLDMEVWFEIPEEYDEAKYRQLKELQPDPRRRPTTGTRVWTGIITFDAPGSFHFMGLSEDQMKKMFALRQGITISKM